MNVWICLWKICMFLDIKFEQYTNCEGLQIGYIIEGELMAMCCVEWVFVFGWNLENVLRWGLYLKR